MIIEIYKDITDTHTMIWVVYTGLKSWSAGCGLHLSEHNSFGVDGHILGGVVCLIDANESISHLKHVVPQRDDDELSILGLFLQSFGQVKKRTLEIGENVRIEAGTNCFLSGTQC